MYAKFNRRKNNYEKTLKEIKALKEKNIQVVLSTSCSLLHVPYTLKHENKLSQKYLSHFAFAEEKLVELQELSKLADLKDYSSEDTYKNNQKLFARDSRDCENDKVKQRLSKITERDYIRLPKRSERQKLQKEVL